MTEPEIGIAADELADDDLVRELDHLHETRHDVVWTGTAAALRHHSARTAELEHEVVRRYPDRVADAEAKLGELD